VKIPDLITAELLSTRPSEVNIIPCTYDLFFDRVILKNLLHNNPIVIIITRSKKKTACAVFLH